MIAQAYHVMLKKPEKVAHVFTSHIDKEVELLFYETDNIATSNTQTAFWKCFY